MSHYLECGKIILTFEFPADDVVPLIKLERQITVRLDLAGEVGVHGGLRGGAHSNRLLQVRLASLGHPCNFSSKSFNMLFLPFQVVCADENGEVCIADFERLDLSVKPAFDRFPDGVGRRFEDITEWN